MQHRPASPDPRGELAATPTRPAYDWSVFGRHRLRVPAGVLIDAPVGVPGHGWLATLWPQPDSEVGWARMLWEPDHVHGTGWIVPQRLAGGDVIEFGADQPDHVARWYGIIDSYDAVEWLTVQGPYNDPTAAHDHAQALLAAVRYQPPLRATSARRPCTRPRAHRRP